MFRYQEVNVESKVKLDCMWADMSLIYEWKVKVLVHKNNCIAFFFILDV